MVRDLEPGDGAAGAGSGGDPSRAPRRRVARGFPDAPAIGGGAGVGVGGRAGGVPVAPEVRESVDGGVLHRALEECGDARLRRGESAHGVAAHAHGSHGARGGVGGGGADGRDEDEDHLRVPAHVVAQVQARGDASTPHVDAALEEVRGGEQARRVRGGHVVAQHDDRARDWRLLRCRVTKIPRGGRARGRAREPAGARARGMALSRARRVRPRDGSTRGEREVSPPPRHDDAAAAD